MSGSLAQRLGRWDQGTDRPPSCAVPDRTWADQRLQPPKRRKVRRAYWGRIASPFDAPVPVNAAGRVYGEPALPRSIWRPLPRETKRAGFGLRDGGRSTKYDRTCLHFARSSRRLLTVASLPGGGRQVSRNGKGKATANTADRHRRPCMDVPLDRPVKIRPHTGARHRTGIPASRAHLPGPHNTRILLAERVRSTDAR